MFAELSNELLVYVGGAFLLGLILAVVISKILAKSRAAKRDSRDAQILALQAELRIAKTNDCEAQTDLQDLEDKLRETHVGLEYRDTVISDQQSKLDKVSTQLKESVQKTHELRTELADRATESIRAEAKIREVETELSVAQASSDMIASGILDYSMAPKNQEQDDRNSDDDTQANEVSNASR